MKRKAKSTTSATSLTHEELQSMLVAVLGTIRGSDTDDNSYNSILALWTKELKPPPLSKKASGASIAEDRASEIVWYRKAFDYWEDESNCPISDDGVLGGYGRVTPMDVRDSNSFIDSDFQTNDAQCFQNRLLICMGPGFQLDRVADCGAGIGRVTRHLLLPRSAHVDLVEQSPRLLNAAPQYMASGDGLEFNPDSVTYLNLGLQDFSPSAATYDLIWVQWVIGHLHDIDCVQFLRRCAAGLKPCGVIVLKDNVLIDEDLTFLWDRTDSSVARHMRYLKLLISLSGLQVIMEARQQDFPSELLPVFMIAISVAPSLLTDTPSIFSSTSSNV